MTDDAELLRRYATDSSEAAFAELVQRHLGLVYHAARRQCGGDGHRAEDVAQVVFASLARKAGELSRRPTLAGWLYTTTRYAAIQAVRAEARRQAREREAERLSAVNADEAGPAAWARLEPVIDEALRALPEIDREAVLLRFFERWPLAEVGARFGLSEDAARMRIERALGKMRRILGRQGVTSTAAALAAALEAHAAGTAPAGLAAAVVAGAVSGTAAAGAVAGATLLMSTTKVSVGIIVALVAVGSAGLVWQHRAIRRLRAEAASSAQLAVENSQLRTENARLQRSAAPSAAGRPAATAPAVAPAPKGGRAAVPLAAGLVDVESLGNAGQASARAAFATQLWAARTGNVALEAGTLLLSDDEKAKLEALRPTLPADVQSQYPTPEDLLAFALAGSPHPVGGMQVLGETNQGPDDVTLQTQWQHTDDDVVHQNDIQFHSDAGTWKMVVPPVIVNRAAIFLGR